MLLLEKDHKFIFAICDKKMVLLVKQVVFYCTYMYFIYNSLYSNIKSENLNFNENL